MAKACSKGAELHNCRGARDKVFCCICLKKIHSAGCYSLDTCCAGYIRILFCFVTVHNISAMESNLQSWPCGSGSSCHDGKILLLNWLCRDQMHSQAKATSLILLLNLLVQATLLQVCVTCQSEQKGLLNYFILLRDVQVVWYGYNVELRWKLRSIPGPRPSFLVGNMLDVRQLRISVLQSKSFSCECCLQYIWDRY